MPREIDFRAWDKKNKAMEFGGEYGPFIRLDGNFGIIENYQGGELTGSWTSWESWKDDYELMQWTGLRDSKGVKVFEGDVVGKIRNDKIISYKIIKFDDFEETFYTDNFNSIAASEIYAGTCYYRGFNISKEEVCESIVMGNIYQNPELLEVKND